MIPQIFLQILFLEVLPLKSPPKNVLEALWKIANEEKIDGLTELISEHWLSHGDDDNSSTAESYIDLR